MLNCCQRLALRVHPRLGPTEADHRPSLQVTTGILAAIAIPKFANTKGKAVLAGMKSDLRVTAQEAFFSDNQTYATGSGTAPNAAVKAEGAPACY